jgi:hypothetical protein
MSVPHVPPRSPRQPRSAAVKALLLTCGLLLLAPGACTLIFIPEYTSSPNPVPSSIMRDWVISFAISALGIALIAYAFRIPIIADAMNGPTILMAVAGVILLLPGVCAAGAMALSGWSSPERFILWPVCFLISAGGAFLLYRAFRKPPPPSA